MAGLGPILMTLGVIYGMAIIVVLQALTSSSRAGVYLYATTGTGAATLDPDLVESTFRPKTA